MVQKKVISFLLALMVFTAQAQYIPFKSKALVYLDGTIGKISSSWYFIDKSGNGRHFLITGIDFDSSNVNKGFPYKSLATISAPAGDATLIAADDSMFYKNGLPQQVPVIALFQDINYSHKIFTRHTVQVLDSTGKEVYIPRVKEIVMYNQVMANNDLLKCQSFYRVPIEDTAYNTTAVWLSPLGNDANTGTKASPKRSLDGIKATTRTTVYLRSGDYDCGATTSTFTGSTLRLQGTGFTAFYLSSGSNGLVNQRTLTIANCDIKDTATSTGITNTGDLTVDRCRVRTIRGSYSFVGNGTNKTLTVKDCIVPTAWTGTSFVRNQGSSANSFQLIGVYGKLVNVFSSSTAIPRVTLKYNRGLSGSSSSFYANGLTWKDNLNIGTFTCANIATLVTFWKETINSTLNLGAVDTITMEYCTVTGNVNGKFFYLKNNTITGTVTIEARNNLLVKGNTINPLTTNAHGLWIQATNGSNTTGVVVDSNYVAINASGGQDLLYVGGIAGDASVNALNNALITRNKLVNLSVVGSGNTHHCRTNGINHKIWYNDITVNGGSGLLFKNPIGTTFTDTVPSAAYNIFRITGTPSYLTLAIGTTGVIVANNTYLNAKVGSVAFESDDVCGANGSMKLMNNLVSLAANIPNFICGTNMTSQYNFIKTNGFTFGTKGTLDSTTTVSIDVNGVPASRLDYGEVIPGNSQGMFPNQGLDATAIIPTNVVYRNQNTPWQRGAYPLP